MAHPLDTRIRSRHALDGIRGSLVLAPDSPRQPDPGSGAAGARPGHVVPLRPRPVARDGVTRHGTLAPTDSQGRVSLGKALRGLGWSATTSLVVRVEGNTAVVGARVLDSPLMSRVSVDQHGRLTLPPVVRAALKLDRGDQVLAIALPGRQELQLHAAADALQAITGALAPDVPDIATEAIHSVSRSRSRVRRAFRAESG